MPSLFKDIHEHLKLTQDELINTCQNKFKSDVFCCWQKVLCCTHSPDLLNLTLSTFWFICGDSFSPETDDGHASDEKKTNKVNIL